MLDCISSRASLLSGNVRVVSPGFAVCCYKGQRSPQAINGLSSEPTSALFEPQVTLSKRLAAVGLRRWLRARTPYITQRTPILTFPHERGKELRAQVTPSKRLAAVKLRRWLRARTPCIRHRTPILTFPHGGKELRAGVSRLHKLSRLAVNGKRAGRFLPLQRGRTKVGVVPTGFAVCCYNGQRSPQSICGRRRS